MFPHDARPFHQECRLQWAIAAAVCSSLLYVGVAAKEPLHQNDTTANETVDMENKTTTTTITSTTSETTNTTSSPYFGFSRTTNTTTTTSSSTTSTSTTNNWVCIPGEELVPSIGAKVCRPCPVGFFKQETGQGICEACPPGSETFFSGAKNLDDCRCNTTTYKEGNASSFSCTHCPPKSVAGWDATSIASCQCLEGHVRVPTVGVLEYCREPFPCDVQARLLVHNVTGPSLDELQMGTCGNITWLEHKKTCNLVCSPGTAPQDRSNIIEAIDTSVLCEDGEITRYPTAGTWCSRDAYLLPPLVFLGTVAVAGVLAGTFIERRQHRWAEECKQVLRFKLQRRPERRNSRDRGFSSGDSSINAVRSDDSSD